MARTNKYASINFNNILEKNHHPSSATAHSGASTKPPSSSSYSSITSHNNNYNTNNTLYKSHGRMLVLTRPTPKPLPTTNPPLTPSLKSQTQQPQTQIPVRTRPGPAPDQISLRPLGHTGTGPEQFSPIPGQERDKEVVAIVGSPKTGKFVPPHLRPGFAGREEKPAPEVSRSRESGQKYFGSPDLDRVGIGPVLVDHETLVMWSSCPRTEMKFLETKDGLPRAAAIL
ncbi:hypothetical protein LWI28_006112 [Acer negundo]|uniref:Uncharacterized protein n=1 Tax=Acer negundo TaxID=4023 RepID=A0AAD5NRF7_ACENE|nr:hypothetical protein LWI28_006112 [Acer negundo]KAK4846057.1 hypothetical protein QYF36_012532 [Acer negundo]